MGMQSDQVQGTGASDLYLQSRRAAWTGLTVALGLGVAKCLGGWFGHSLALLSDSVHSLGDALSSALLLAALWWSEKPADREHPYGHTRIETIAAAHLAFLLVLSGVWVGYEAITHWSTPGPAPKWYTLGIALLSAVVNAALSRYSRSVAQFTSSKAIEASAWDQRLDMLGSCIVLLGLLVAVVAGPQWHAVDHVAALAVAVIIIFAGGRLYWGSLQELMDRQASPQLLTQLRGAALAVPGVRGVEKLFARKSGLEYFIDIHVEVSPTMSVIEGHRLGHEVKDRLKCEFPAVRDVLVHIEPCG